MADPGSDARALLDRYELLEQVGRGGMGEVWLGRDRRLQRDVAVKLLLPQLSQEPSFRERFAIEARAAAALEHPNVVNVYDIDEDEELGTSFIVMERLPGPSLDRRIAEGGPLGEEELRRVAADLLSGLAALHEAHLVHRDIKPGNLIRSAGGRWKVGDFGVAKDLSAAASLTLAGVAVGTPAYLAPEQLDGHPSTPATDLWAAAVVLREALTGVRPFPGDDPIAVAHAVQGTPLVPLATLRPDVDPAITAAIDRALSRDPALRFTTAGDMLAAIEGRPVPVPVALAEEPPPVVEVPTPVPVEADTRSRAAWWAAAVVAVLALAVLAVLFAVAALSEDDADDQPAPATAPPTTLPDADLEPAPSSMEDGATNEPQRQPSTTEEDVVGGEAGEAGDAGPAGEEGDEPPP